MNHSPKQTRNPAATFVVTALIAVTLTACGGGGGGGGGSSSSGGNTGGLTAKPLSLSGTESSTITETLDGTIDTSSLSFVIDNPAINVSASGNTLTIDIDELQNEGIARFTVETSANSRYTVNVQAENTSAVALVRQAELLTAENAGITLLADDVRLQNVLLELEYLGNEITETQKSSIQSSTTSTLNAGTPAIDQETDTLASVLANYESGDVAESDLENALQAASNVITTGWGDIGEQLLADRLATLSAMGINLPGTLEDSYPLTFEAGFDRYTRWIDPEFGTDNGDTFTYISNANDYDFFNTVFTFAE